MPYNGQSLPNGHLKDVNMGSSSADVSMRSGASKCGDLVNVYNISVGEDSSSMNGFYFDTVPPISSRFGWDGRRSACTPPVGKSKGSSSGSGTFNSNPSLTCFRIDEDAVMEDGQLDELDGMSLKGVTSKERKMPPSRHVLGNVTSVCQNAQIFHASTEILERSLDSVNTESDNLMQISMNHDTAKSCNFEHGYQKEAKGKENKCPSVGKNKVLRSSESLHSTISRPNLTSNACERNTSQKFSGKVLKTNNIVSNVSSFIPFVQQKQPAAGVLTGKRDIKVKALEAAEVAKRMAEKKENERKMKKEAARLERAKLEQENARQMEIKKKLERKKKEVNMEARKRQREEDEKKERERKRKCVEENRRQQKEQEEKLRCEKEGRLQKRKIADGKSRKETEDSKRQNNVKKEKEVSGTMDTLKMDPKNAKLSVENFVNGSSILKDVESCKEPTEKVNSAYGLQKASGREFQDLEEEQKSQSCEISPYRDSDDEEEDEEDNRHKGKIFPPWTRKEFLFEFLRAQQHIDASKIFPRAKCFNCEDILPPRNKR
ncbi:hypothetical protein QJS10_CPB17g00419 [Acorus calamus]|uniref:Inner centromere protein ARK-binding domain-containing protein n=1 Tax=Acorus calamus TaxID=4465 RepID=A0AAV9CSP6_ACOCL|nr:hypothetical protein QJS10_CPB17g00419 [Acorus calamus]